VEEMFRSITELVLRSKKGGQPRALKPKMGISMKDVAEKENKISCRH
jgi:hypothetical protein